MTKLPQDIKPFIIKSDKKLCGMNSALQCLLSLPNFLKTLNLPKNADILKTFQSFLKEPHDLQEMKKFIEKKKRNVDFQDSFAVIDSFIDIMTNNKEFDTENLFCGNMSEINICSDCEVPDEVNKTKFSSIELSFKESLRILYVPYELEEPPILTTIAGLKEKQNYVFIQQKSEKIVIIENDEIFKSHSNSIYAFELPKYSKDNKIAIIQLNFKSGGSMPVPMLCEIPKNKEMKDAILKRIQSLFKAKNLSIQIQNNISKTTEFNKYNLYSEFIQITVSGYYQILKDRKPEVDEDISLSLNEMFDGFISLSKLEDEKKCKYCKKTNKPYFRKRLTKLPQILILRIKKTAELDFNSIDVKIPEFIYLNTSDYNEFDEIGNPDDYKAFKNIYMYELRATSNHFGNSNNIKTVSNFKRENQWYKMLDDKLTKKDDYPKESSNVDLLFYEIIGDTKKYGHVDSIDEEEPRPSSKRTTKLKITYFLSGMRNKTNSIMLDHNELKNATDIIKFFRQKCKDEKINGFKIKDKDYYDGDKISFDDIFPPEKRATPIVEILYEEQVSKPPSKPSNPLENNIRKNLKRIPSASGKNLSYALIDNSSSMIACFKDSGKRRSKVAVESINRFLRNGSLYCNSDNFFFYESIRNKEAKEAEYNKDNFIDRSDLYSNLDYVVDMVIKKVGFQNKRILLISDGIFIPDEGEGDDDNTLMDVYKKIIENQIILDVILLKNDTNIVKELCAVSHISGGYYFYPESLDDLNEFIDEEKFINFQKRDISFQNYADEKIIENVAKYIFATTNIVSYKKHKLREEIMLASPFYNYPTKDDDKIEEEIDNCAAAQNDKKQFYSIYRLSDRNGGFLKQRAIVFLKSNKGPLLLFEIFFPSSYPDEEPLFKLASDVKMEKIPNYLFNVLEKKYSKKTKLIDLIKELNKRLQSEDVEDAKDDFDSFDKIEVVYRTTYGEKEKNFDD